MGKKKNKKLKKILRAQVISEANATPQISSQPNQSAVINEPVDTPVISSREAEVIQISEDKKDVRHEIKKILLTVVILVLIIVAVDIVNSKTDIILKIGQFIAEKLNLNL